MVDYAGLNYKQVLPGRRPLLLRHRQAIPGRRAREGAVDPLRGPIPFKGYKVSDRPAAATKMCILVANMDHSVIQGTGNCVDPAP